MGRDSPEGFASFPSGKTSRSITTAPVWPFKAARIFRKCSSLAGFPSAGDRVN